MKTSSALDLAWDIIEKTPPQPSDEALDERASKLAECLSDGQVLPDILRNLPALNHYAKKCVVLRSLTSARPDQRPVATDVAKSMLTEDDLAVQADAVEALIAINSASSMRELAWFLAGRASVVMRDHARELLVDC